MRPDFPLPDTTWEPTAEFWAGAAREELRIPRLRAVRPGLLVPAGALPVL